MAALVLLHTELIFCNTKPSVSADKNWFISLPPVEQRRTPDNIGYQLAGVNRVPGAVTTGADVGDLLCGVLQEQS